MVYIHVKFKHDIKCFWVRVLKQIFFSNRLTDKHIKRHEFRKQPSYGGRLPLCQVWNQLLKVFWSKCLETKIFENRLMDKQMKRPEFWKCPSNDRGLPLCQLWNKIMKAFLSLEYWSKIYFELESWNKNIFSNRLTDKQRNKKARISKAL